MKASAAQSTASWRPAGSGAVQKRPASSVLGTPASCLLTASYTPPLATPQSACRWLASGLPAGLPLACRWLAGGLPVACRWLAGGLPVACRLACRWLAGGLPIRRDQLAILGFKKSIFAVRKSFSFSFLFSFFSAPPLPAPLTSPLCGTTPEQSGWLS